MRGPLSWHFQPLLSSEFCVPFIGWADTVRVRPGKFRVAEHQIYDLTERITSRKAAGFGKVRVPVLSPRKCPRIGACNRFH